MIVLRSVFKSAMMMPFVLLLWGCGDEDLPGVPDTEAPTVQLTAPNGGEAVALGSVLNISWEASDDNGAVEVDLSYTADGVTETSIASGEIGGSYAWTVPSTNLYGVRVKATASDSASNTASDESDEIFAVVAASARGYVTSSVCQDCHSDEYVDVFNSGHPYKLNKVVNG